MQPSTEKQMQAYILAQRLEQALRDLTALWSDAGEDIDTLLTPNYPFDRCIGDVWTDVRNWVDGVHFTQPTPKNVQQVKDAQDFIEKWHPNYSASYDIATINDLELLMSLQQEDIPSEEITDTAQNLLDNEYEGNIESIIIAHDYYQTSCKVYKEAIENFIRLNS